jgi:hypothetical protein
LPAQFTFGSAPRNSVLGPGFANVDLAIAKTWSLPGTHQPGIPLGSLQSLQPRELRHPERIFGTANFGRIFSAKNAREMQFGCDWRSSV